MKRYKTFCHHIVKAMNNHDLYLQRLAVECIDSLLHSLLLAITSRVIDLLVVEERKTIGQRELETASDMIIPSQLSAIAIDNANKSLGKFNKNRCKGYQTRESRCELTLPVSIIERYLRSPTYTFNVSATAPIFLTAIVDTVMHHILYLLAKRKCTTLNHLYLAIQKDDEMRQLVSKLGIRFLRGGVEPTSDSVKVRKIQTSEENQIQKTPFERLLREVASLIEDDNLRFSQHFLYPFQSLVEREVVQILQVASKITQHSKRKIVYPHDIDLAVEITSPYLSDIQKGNESIPISSLRRLTLQAGINMVCNKSLKSCEDLIRSVIHYHLSDIILRTKFHRVCTVTFDHMVETLAMKGIFIPLPMCQDMPLREEDSISAVSDIEAEEDE